jgi:hypothetical protein
MLFFLLAMGLTTSPVPDQALAARIREMTNQMLLSQSDSEESAIDKAVQEIYARHGLLATPEVGDEAAYDFVFLLTNQPRAFQTEVLRSLELPGVEHRLPTDAVTFFRTRFRLDGIKSKSQDKPPSNLALRDAINKLYESDQAARQKEGFDPERLAATDRMHSEQLQAIFKKYGVPTFDMVGPEAAGHFVIMIQHQSPQMRDLVLPALRAGVEAGQADPESYALVYDLSQLDKGKKQRFGERLVCQSGKLHEAPIEDEEHVNQRRAEIGLMRIELYSYLVARIMPQMCSAPSPQ